MNHKIVIDYYSDVLCIWAWVAQKRIDELNKNLAGKIEFRHHYMDIFGDCQDKMDSQWSDKGHFNGFFNHVLSSAEPYADVIVSNDIWSKVRPTTSANVHLILKAIELVYGQQISVNLAVSYREAFFVYAKDISDFDTLYKIAEQNDLEAYLLKEVINNGKAISKLMKNYQDVKLLSLKGSPTFIIDNGRQTLFGNVGYRVLYANITELLKNYSDEASWC